MDNTSGCQLYLSEDSLETSISTAKSSEINVLVPGAEPDGDWVCFHVPILYLILQGLVLLMFVSYDLLIAKLVPHHLNMNSFNRAFSLFPQISWRQFNALTIENWILQYAFVIVNDVFQCNIEDILLPTSICTVRNLNLLIYHTMSHTAVDGTHLYIQSYLKHFKITCGLLTQFWSQIS